MYLISQRFAKSDLNTLFFVVTAVIAVPVDLSFYLKTRDSPNSNCPDLNRYIAKTRLLQMNAKKIKIPWEALSMTKTYPSASTTVNV